MVGSVVRKEGGKDVGGRDLSEDAVFGMGPEVGLGFAWEEQKASEKQRQEQTCGDRSGRGLVRELWDYVLTNSTGRVLSMVVCGLTG